jgi:hypothetical protein
MIHNIMNKANTTIQKSKCQINNEYYSNQLDKIIKIQKTIRGFLYRLKRLPLILYIVKDYLERTPFTFSSQTTDGRINSCLDEGKIIELLEKKYNNKIKKADKRHWWDLLIRDNKYGWLPVNIKTTTLKTSDNMGNLALCVYSYTNENLDLNKLYNNGEMSEILFKKLKNKEFNKIYKKDYYFIVLNKTKKLDVIINSVKGLTHLTPNINNLPFQVKWNNNRVYKYDTINNKIKMLIECLVRPKPSWQETFMSNIRTIKI